MNFLSEFYVDIILLLPTYSAFLAKKKLCGLQTVTFDLLTLETRLLSSGKLITTVSSKHSVE